jgi:hypothetical protein
MNTTKEANDKGREAYFAGKELNDKNNPYPKDSEEYYAWIRGWVCAMDDSL